MVVERPTSNFSSSVIDDPHPHLGGPLSSFHHESCGVEQPPNGRTNEPSRDPLRLPFICRPIGASVALSCLWQDRNHEGDDTCNCLRW